MTRKTAQFTVFNPQSPPSPTPSPPTSSPPPPTGSPPPVPGNLLTPPTFVGRWGGSGTAPGQFDEVSSVDVLSTGQVIGVGHENRLQVFTPDGSQLLYIFGSPGSGNGQFQHPHGIGIDRNRSPNIAFCGDQDNGRIQIWQVTPTAATFIKNVGNADVVHIHDIGIHRPSGDILAPDYEVDHLQRFDPDTGALVWKRIGLNGGWGCDTDSQGFIYVAATNSQQLHKLSPTNGATIKQVGGFSGGQGITGVYVDRHDLVYVIDTPKKLVQIYDTELALKATWNLSNILTGQGLSKPEDITITNDDRDIYIADSVSNYIYHMRRAA